MNHIICIIRFKEFEYYGVQNGDECYCGDNDSKFILTDPIECNKPCVGDSSERCGASWRMNVYSNRAYDFSTTAQTTTDVPLGETKQFMGELMRW